MIVFLSSNFVVTFHFIRLLKQSSLCFLIVFFWGGVKESTPRPITIAEAVASSAVKTAIDIDAKVLFIK